MRTYSLAILVALLATTSARAQEVPAPEPVVDRTDARARELFENGRVLFDEGRYRDAISAWEESYNLSKRPLLLFNIGNAYEQLGELESALEWLNRYRAFAPTEERAGLEGRIRSLEERLAAAPPEADAPSDPPVVPEHLPKKSALGVAEWTLAGVAVAGLGVGIAFGVSAEAARTNALQYCTELDGKTLCTDEAQPWIDKQKQRALAADIGFGVAVGATVAGVVVLLVDSRGPVVVPVPLSGGAGLRISGSFR